MGFFKTKKCFFTGQDVKSCDETNGECLDGYYYRISYNGKIREVRLIWDHNWENDAWIHQYGQSFFELLDKTENWNVFEGALNIDEISQIYSGMMKNKG